MLRRWIKRILGAGVIGGAVYAMWRVLDERSKTSELVWTAQPFPSPPRPEIRTPVADASDAPWVEPEGGACPMTHPLKAKMQSGIFHEPGGQMYDRTIADRCYRDADAASADGLRASKR